MGALRAAVLAALLAAPPASATTLDGDGHDTSLTTEQTAALKDADEKGKIARAAREIAADGGATLPSGKNTGWVSDWWGKLDADEKGKVKKHWKETGQDRDGNPTANISWLGRVYGQQASQEGDGTPASNSSQYNPLTWGGETVANTAAAAAQPEETQLSPHLLNSFSPGDRGYGDAQMALGTQDQQRGNHRAALGRYETALSYGKDDARTLTFASLAALNADEPRKAALWSAQALEKDPGGALARQAEAISKMALKRLPKEEDPVAHPPRRPPESAAAPPGAATAIPELDRPLPPRAADPGLPPEAVALLAATNRLVAQASKAYRTGDIKEAVKLAGEALLKDPDDVRAIQVRAASLAKAGQWEEARQDAERGLDLAPGYVPLLLLRAAAAAHAKDWRSVRADAQTVINKESANPTAWRFLGIAQAGLGERSEALASLARSAGYGDPDAPRLLAAARSLPPGADVVDLVEMLTGAAAEREAAAAARTAPAAPARRGKTVVVLGAALLAGLAAGGLILLAGRRDEDRA